jgi:hypothetical protein
MHFNRGVSISHLGARQAATSSQQNITSSFIKSPNTRGTLDILFSSLFTTLICVWALQHLNIPPPFPQATSWRQTVYHFSARLLNQIKFLILTLICPEIWIGKAFQDFMVARRSCRDMRNLAKADGVAWTMTHACFANLGGFKFKVKGEPWLADMLGATSSRSTISLVSLERIYETVRAKNSAARPVNDSSQTGQGTEMSERGENMVANSEIRNPSLHSSMTGPRSIRDRDSIQETQETPPTSVSSSDVGSEHDGSSVDSTRTDDSRSTEERRAEELFDPYYIYPNADQIKAMRECGAIDRLPQLSAAQIHGMSNTSALGKTVACVQISWFMLQIITRVAKHLPISQLEVATLAFVICSILMYLLFSSIPRGITASVEVNLDCPIHGERLHHFASDLLKLGGYSGFALHFWPGGIHQRPNLMFPPPNDIVRDDGPRITKHNDVQQYCYGKIGLSLAGTLFGVVHCLAWSLDFPTPAERIVWRTSSLFISLAFVSWPMSFILFLKLADGPGRKTFVVLWVLTLISNVVYALARAALLVLVLRCLFYLPVEAFVLTWADEIPHFS